MKYEYSIRKDIYYNEIKNFTKKSNALKRIRKRPLVLMSSFTFVIAIILFMKNLIQNKYDRNFTDIFLEHFIIYIITTSICCLFISILIKFRENKFLTKQFDKDTTHILDIKDQTIYYGVNSKNSPNIRLELDNNLLKEISDLDNIFGIIISYKENLKNLYSIIIIPKDIFKTEDELSEFKNLLENKL